MITGPDNCALLFLHEYMDPERPSGLWWLKDILDVGSLKDNAVCLAAGAAWNEVNDWVEWLSQFPYILIAAPEGPWRDEAIRELSARSPIPVMVADGNAFYGTKCVTELAREVGAYAVDNLLLGAEEVPRAGILDFSDIDTSESNNVKRTMSGFPALDKAIGGFAPGELSVWTGKRGEGKSTLMGQILLDAVDQNHVVCAYSGELPAKQFKTGLQQQAAGYLHLQRVEDTQSGKVLYPLCPGIAEEIDDWAKGRLLLTDIKQQNAHDEDNIIRLFEYAVRRYGADTFLVDNIMTANLKNEPVLGFWRAQSLFTGRLMAFAIKNNVHVHLVAHPKKTGSGQIEADDVAGSSDITNRANNVFKVERVPEDKVQSAGYSALLTILKNREFGARDRIKLDFNVPSRRFFSAGGSPAKKHYSWEAKMRSG